MNGIEYITYFVYILNNLVLGSRWIDKKFFGHVIQRDVELMPVNYLEHEPVRSSWVVFWSLMACSDRCWLCQYLWRDVLNTEPSMESLL